MAMVTNLPASTARDVKLGIINEDRAYVYPYLKNYMNNSFLVFLLLHHERQILLKCKKETSKLLIQKNPQIEKLKSKILDCLSIYSFETVSDDAITQLVYSKYKEVLKLSLLEENMSDFIFKLDDEIAKKKDERINKLTLPITILGIISVIAAIMDIIRHILDYMGIFSS